MDPVEGWAIELIGEEVDLADAMEIFADGYRLTIKPHQEGDDKTVLLRSCGWRLMDSVREVMADAEQVVRELNGALLLTHGDARPLKTGRIMRWDASGCRTPILITASAHILLDEVRARGRVTVSGGAGPAPPPPARAWMDAAEKSDLMSELLAHIGRATEWFDLFKAIELAQRIFSEARMKCELGPARWKLWVSARRCANFRRHSKAKQEPMLESELTFREARRRVVQDIRFLLERTGREHRR